MHGQATVALLHSPVVGPLTWRPTAERLKAHGYRVAVPSLAGLLDTGPPYYQRLAEAVARTLEREAAVVLVGHSGAGPLLPAIAHRLGGRVDAAIFVDALLPHPGVSWFDTAPSGMREQLLGLADDGLLRPWNEWFPTGTVEALIPNSALRQRFVDELPKLAMGYFEEPAPAVATLNSVPCAFVRLSEAYDGAADEAQRRGWWVHREDADHLAMLTRPDMVAGCIREALAAATSAPP